MGSSQLLGAPWSLLYTDDGGSQKVDFCPGEKHCTAMQTAFLKPSATKLHPEQKRAPATPGLDVPPKMPGAKIRPNTEPCTLRLEAVEARLSFRVLTMTMWAGGGLSRAKPQPLQ